MLSIEKIAYSMSLNVFSRLNLNSQSRRNAIIEPDKNHTYSRNILKYISKIVTIFTIIRVTRFPEY